MEQVVFAHVSDPHFADSAITPEPVESLGQNGHDLVLCKELRQGLEMLRERAEFHPEAILPIVMSGDLSRTGVNPLEFAVGNQYFESRWPNPSNTPEAEFGLQVTQAHYVRIPGNHDHWDGDLRNQWGYNPAIKPVHFPETVFQHALTDANVEPEQARLIVELFGVDSESGFPPIGIGTNQRARGRISDTELHALTNRLATSLAQATNDAAAGIRRVRVIVCHHSFQGNWLISWFRGSLELETKSRKALEYLASRYEVTAILTGHAHDFLAERYLVPGGRWLREFRCATTLQARAQYFKQGFFGHRITLQDDGSLTWTAYPFQWQGTYFYPLPVDESAPPPGTWNPFHFPIDGASSRNWRG